MAGDSLNSVFGRKLPMAIALSLASALPASSVYAEHIPADRRMVDEQPFTLRADSVREVSLSAPNSSFRIDVVGAVKHGPQRMGDDDAWWGITLLDTDGRERMAVRLLCGTEPYDATFSRPYLRVVVDSVSEEGRRFPVAARHLFKASIRIKVSTGCAWPTKIIKCWLLSALNSCSQRPDSLMTPLWRRLL